MQQAVGEHGDCFESYVRVSAHELFSAALRLFPELRMSDPEALNG
jgi:hypothetical protein